MRRTFILESAIGAYSHGILLKQKGIVFYQTNINFDVNFLYLPLVFMTDLVSGLALAAPSRCYYV